MPREAFVAALSGTLAEYAAPQPVGLMILDVDHLGRLNGDFGLAFGDQVLKAIAAYLKQSSHRFRLVGRINGGAFGLLLPGVVCGEFEKHARHVVESLSADLLQLNPHALVTLSAGGVIAGTTPETAASLVSAAEGALRQAKQSGRNKIIIVAASQQCETQSSARIGRIINDALDTKRLTLFFQPVVDAKSGQAAFHECLLRLPASDGMLVSAAELIPVAEDVGLIRAIDGWVLDRAICELVAYRSARLSLNVSAFSISDPRWVARLEEACRQHRDVARRLIVEITETAASLDPSAVAGFADRVRSTGAQIALDDFGAGVTSIAHLRSIPIDMVKIDGQFTRRAGEDAENQLVLEALIRLANGLGFATVAERAETAADAAYLTAAGVTYIQGYHFGRPHRQRLPALAEAIQ